MRFTKKDGIYRITLLSGAQNNILGISFVEKDSSADGIELIEWNFPNSDKSRIRTSKEEILKQVLSGLDSVNQSLGTNYKLSKIYFSPFDSSANQIYSGLIAVLIRHYHNGHEFEEI